MRSLGGLCHQPGERETEGEGERGVTFPPDVYALKRSSLDRLAGLIEGTNK